MKIDRILTVAWLLMCHQGAIDASLFVGPAEIEKQTIELWVAHAHWRS